MGMNEQEFKKLLTQAVSETIENMSFMIVDTIGENQPEIKADDCIKSSLLILEPYHGELGLTMQKKLIAKIAAALYGRSEEEITEPMLLDLVAELLNTLTGNFMRRILPAEFEYKLGLPECGDHDYLDTGCPPLQCTFAIDGQHLIVTAYMESFFQDSASDNE